MIWIYCLSLTQLYSDSKDYFCYMYKYVADHININKVLTSCVLVLVIALSLTESQNIRRIHFWRGLLHNLSPLPTRLLMLYNKSLAFWLETTWATSSFIISVGTFQSSSRIRWEMSKFIFGLLAVLICIIAEGKFGRKYNISIYNW